MTNFIWPSDQDRADDDELNRVCEYLEEVLKERDALAVYVEALLGCLKIDDDGANISKLADLMTLATRKPATHMARMKAQWQAEAVERVLSMECFMQNAYLESLKHKAGGCDG